MPARLRLDELLGELLNRADEVMSAHAKLRGLLDAVIVVASNLDLHITLRRIAEAACDLADARYGALGVVGPDRQLNDFIHVGLDDDDAKRIGQLPSGRGVLGLLIDDPKPLRLRDIGSHPACYGFPPNHPPMSSFLGVPIRVRGEVFGNLYLTEKQSDDGGFTEGDEELVTALAAAAAVAIENARLYAETQRRERWLQASAEVTAALLGLTDPTTSLALVARRVRQVAEAELGAVVLPVPDTASLVIEVVDGLGADQVTGMLLPVSTSLSAEVIRTGESAYVADAQEEPRLSIRDRLPWLGAIAIVPLIAGGRPLGALLLAHSRERGRQFSPLDREMAAAFAGHASLALEFARAQRDRERLAVYEDRDRIARDLHDLVIQRLFATGLTLQGLSKYVDTSERPRLESAVDDLDGTIREIRRTIFSLRAAEGPTTSLRGEILDLAGNAAASLGFEPHVRLEGPIDSAVPTEVQPHLLAVLREALSNVTRHSDARTVHVNVKASGSELTLTVIDDGRGLGASARRSGLDNMLRRAEGLGGTFHLGTSPDAEDQGAAKGGRPGTRLVWRVPLDD